MKTENVKVAQLLAVLLSGAFVALLNETLLNVAMNAIMKDLHISAAKAQWLTTSYMLVIGMLIPISAFLMERFTTRQLFISAMVLFVAGTGIAGVGHHFMLLLGGRIIQAAGTAVLIPLVTNIVLVVIPVSSRGTAIGLVGLVTMFAPALGPTLSGLIVEHLSWRWLFYMVWPIAVLSLLSGVFLLKNVTKPSMPRLDVLSFILSSLGFGGIVYGFSLIGEGGSGNEASILIDIIGGALCLGLFVIRQKRLAAPMINLSVFGYPMFSLGIILIVIVMISMFAMMLVLPIYLQGSLAFSAVLTGLVMLPGGFVNGLVSPIIGRVFDKRGPRVLLLPGICLMVLTFFGLRFVEAGVQPWLVTLLHCMLMISVAMVIMPVQTNGLNQLPPDLYPHGTAVISTIMQVSGAIGTALFISIMEIGSRSALSGIPNPSEAESAAALAAGVQQAFFAGLLLAVLGLAVSFFVKRVRIGEPIHEEKPPLERAAH